MTTAPLCALCGKPTGDNAYVCTAWGCAGQLEQALAETPALATELDTALARQSHISRNGRPDPQDVLTAEDRAEIVIADAEASVHIQSLPYDLGASKAQAQLHQTLTRWTRQLAADRGLLMPLPTLGALSSLLLAHIEWFRHQPFAGVAVIELKEACWRAWNACDRPADLVYAGPCDSKGEFGDEPCLQSLYARVGAKTVECDCGLSWDVQGRRDFMLEAAQDTLVTAAELSRFLTVYGEPVTGERVRKWAQRGQLAQHGNNERGHPLYRVGEASELLAQMNRRTA
jgi:hypothetical protein